MSEDSVSVSSVSQKPFNSELTVGASVFLKVPQRRHGLWIVSLNYPVANEGEPLTSRVEYIWQPSERFHTDLGLVVPLVTVPREEPSLDLSFKLSPPVPP
jgi:hypothetical protein